MIEIRVNNGTIQYRHKLTALYSSGVVHEKDWSEWKQADYLGPVTSVPNKSKVKGVFDKFLSFGGPVEFPKVWFDGASDIPTFKFTVPPGVGKLGEQWAADAAKKVHEQLRKDLDEVCGIPVKMTASEVLRRQGKSRLGPEYWAMLNTAAQNTSDNWKRAYDKAVETLRSQSRRHADELQAERKKVVQRNAQISEVAAQRDASNASNKKLIAERDEARALHRAQVRSVEQLKFELLQANQNLALYRTAQPPKHAQSVARMIEENEGMAAEISNLRAELSLTRQAADTWKQSCAQVQHALARTASRSTRARDLLKRMSDLFGEVLPWSRIPDYRMVQKLVEDSNGELLRKD